ncbi:MAG: hypothetical protein U0H96_06145 [Christensenellales bacterium]|nr:hypothetical protein [Christensenellales bacterium]
MMLFFELAGKNIARIWKKRYNKKRLEIQIRSWKNRRGGKQRFTESREIRRVLKGVWKHGKGKPAIA